MPLCESPMSGDTLRQSVPLMTQPLPAFARRGYSSSSPFIKNVEHRFENRSLACKHVAPCRS